MPGRPPAVCEKVTEVGVTTGSGRRSGNAWAWKVRPNAATRMWVLLSTPLPRWLKLVMRPSSTSIVPARWLAKRNTSASRRSVRRAGSMRSGGGAS